MERNDLKKDASLKDILGGFFQSYAQRDTEVAFSDWLADRLRQEMPEMDLEASTRLANEITESVAAYDQTLHDLNQAIEAGQSKEEWLSEQLAEAYSDMSADTAGEALQRMEDELVSSNMQIMGETTAEEASTVEAGPAAWNKYSLKAKTHSIGQQLNSVALCAAASALDRNLNEEKVAVSDVVTDALKNGLKASPSEVKAIVAGAVRASAEKGLTDTLPADTPMEVIGSFAGVAVESAEALCDAANGDITMTAAMDRIGRAAVAAGCRIAAGFLRGTIMILPGGFVLVDLLGGVLDRIESPQFINNVYTVIRGAAVAAWEGIKQSTVAKGLRRLRRRLFS